MHNRGCDMLYHCSNTTTDIPYMYTTTRMVFYVPPQGQKMTKDDACAVLYSAGIQSPDWGKIAKAIALDVAILPSAFFSQWSVLARDRKPSWKALATVLENTGDQNYKQAAINAKRMEGTSTTLQYIL